MAKIKEFFSRIQLTYRRSSNVTKIVVIVAIVLCMGTLIALRIAMNDLQNRTEELRDKAAGLEYANSELDEKTREIGSVKSLVEIAEEILGLVQPGSISFETEPTAE